MKVFEVCLTNYCNFKCDYCISDPSRGNDKFSEPLKLDGNGNLLLHDKNLRPEEVLKRKILLENEGQSALDLYVQAEHDRWMQSRHLKHDYTDWLDFNSLIEFVRTRLSDSWLINLTGGEPLYYPKIDTLISELTKTHKVLVTTNASMIRKFDSLSSISKGMLFFRVGFHPEFRNLDTFVKCVEHIRSSGFKYTVNYVLHPRHYINGSTKYSEYLEILDTNKFDYEITPFEGEFDGVKYPNPQYKMTELENYLFGRLDRYKEHESPMGTSFMLAEPNGEIYECQGKSKKLGNVYDMKVTLQEVSHVDCFTFKGCHTVKSANTYLDKFFCEKIS